MGRATTIRLHPLLGEHFLPMLVDLAAFLAFFGVWTLGLGLPDTGWGIPVLFAVPVLTHLIQMTWLVAVRIDDSAITIIRPWRRRRIEWAQIAGLIFVPAPDPRLGHHLRLVLKGHEPPIGRHLTPAQIHSYVKNSPVIMTVPDLEPHPWSDNRWIIRSIRCRERVYAELERHGLPRPEFRDHEYRTPEYTPEQTRLAAAVDLIGLHGATITHGEPADDHERRLLTTILPELARAHAADDTTASTNEHLTFVFATEDAATAFITQAREIAPANWRITPGALPPGQDSPAAPPAEDQGP